VIKEQEEVIVRYKINSKSHQKRVPPGLSIFQSEQFLKFSFTDLNLERNFGWKLEQSGCPPPFWTGWWGAMTSS
jgi:hypothetical protein